MHAQVDRQLKKKRNMKRNGPESQGEKSWDKTHVEKADREACERDEIWHNRQKERQYDWNLSRAAPDKKSIFQRNKNQGISEVILLLLVCPVLRLPMKFSMTKGCSTNPRVWAVVLQMEKTKFTMFMVKSGEVVNICLRIVAGPVKIWIGTHVMMT